MSVDPLGRDRPILTVSLLGHTGHGKSTLLAALARRMGRRPDSSVGPYGSPAPGPAAAAAPTRTTELRGLASAARRYVFIDLPGHRRFLRESSRMMSMRDAAVLCVSAPEALRGQTLEHVVHARDLSAGELTVFIDRCDAVDDPRWVDAVESEVREALTDAGVDGDEVAFVRGSSQRCLEGDPRWTAGVDALIDLLDAHADVAREPDLPLLFTVCERWRARGNGAVVSGRVLQGRVREGDRVELSGRAGTRNARVVSVQILRQDAKLAEAGEICGVGLELLGQNPVAPFRGEVICAPSRGVTATAVRVELRLLSARRRGRHTPLRSQMRAFFHLGSAGVDGTFELPFEPAELKPGASASDVTVRLDRPTWVTLGMPFAFRDGSVGPRRTRDPDLDWAGTAGSGRVLAIEA